MDDGQEKQVIGDVVAFIRRATGTGAAPEEVAILPGVLHSLLTYTGNKRGYAPGKPSAKGADLPGRTQTRVEHYSKPI